jgi:signal transduction histidine kinase
MIAYRLATVVPTLAILGLSAAREPQAFAHPELLFWLVAVAVVSLLPIPVWGSSQLSFEQPLVLATAVLFGPTVGACVALVGVLDIREFRGEISPLRALSARCQIALPAFLAGAAFHAAATADSPIHALVPAFLAAAVVDYAANTLLVATSIQIGEQIPLRQVLVRMHGSKAPVFLASYFGLTMLGVPFVLFALAGDLWAVALFLVPVLWARQLYFGNRALADRLSEQNGLLERQARQLEALLEREHRTVEDLQELNRLKSQFVAVASHELRTPLTAIIGFAKTLRHAEFAEDPELRNEFLRTMERQGDRLLQLVENLLVTSRVESEPLAADMRSVQVEELCREVIEGLGPESGRVVVRFPGDLPELHTDRHLLGLVVSNLLDNALKYSPDGSTCEIGALPDGSTLALWVRDHGIGIRPADRDGIFERFRQADSSATRNFRGVGLGLSLVKEILDLLGGTVEVESEPGRGSVFTVRLPIAPDAPISTPTETRPRPTLEPPDGDGGPAGSDASSRDRVRHRA